MKYIKKIFETKFDYLKIDKTIKRMCQDLYDEDSYLTMTALQDPDEVPDYLQYFVEMADKKGFYDNDSNIVDVDMLVNELTNEEKLKIYKYHQEYKKDISRIPTKQEVKDYFQIIEDEFDLVLEAFYSYNRDDVMFEWEIEFRSEQFISADGEFEIKPFQELLTHMAHIEQNLDKYNMKFIRNDSVSSLFKIKIFPKN